MWSSISSGLSTLKLLLASDLEAYNALKSFVRKLYGKVAQRVGWSKEDGESHTTSLMRSLVLKVKIIQTHGLCVFIIFMGVR